MKNLFAFFLLSFVFIGCASTVDVVMNEKYDGRDMSGKNLYILPLYKNNIEIKNIDDVEDDFAGDKRDPKTIIREELFQSMMNNSKQYLKNVNLLDTANASKLILFQHDDTKYFSLKRKIGKDTDSIRFYVPRKEMLDSAGIHTDIVVALNEIQFGRNLTMGSMMYIPGNTISTPGGSFTTAGHFVSGGSQEYLGANIKFIIYDYSENDVITYGMTTISSGFLFAMTKSTWEDCFYKIAKEIFLETPFRWSIYNE